MYSIKPTFLKQTVIDFAFFKSTLTQNALFQILVYVGQVVENQKRVAEFQSVYKVLFASGKRVVSLDFAAEFTLFERTQNGFGALAPDEQNNVGNVCDSFAEQAGFFDFPTYP